MSDNLITFDPKSISDKVKQKIQESFVALIPEENWDKLVQEEIDRFFEPVNTVVIKEEEKSTNSYWIKKTFVQLKEEGISPFTALVHSVCIDAVGKKIQDMAIKSVDELIPHSQESEVSEKMMKVITSITPYIMEKMFSNLITEAFLNQKTSVINAIRQTNFQH